MGELENLLIQSFDEVFLGEMTTNAKTFGHRANWFKFTERIHAYLKALVLCDEPLPLIIVVDSFLKSGDQLRIEKVKTLGAVKELNGSISSKGDKFWAPYIVFIDNRTQALDLTPGELPTCGVYEFIPGLSLVVHEVTDLAMACLKCRTLVYDFSIPLAGNQEKFVRVITARDKAVAMAVVVELLRNHQITAKGRGRKLALPKASKEAKKPSSNKPKAIEEKVVSTVRDVSHQHSTRDVITLEPAGERVELDYLKLTMRVDSVAEVSFSKTEWTVLSLLVHAKNDGATLGYLSEQTWGIKSKSKLVSVHLSNIRKKIKSLGLDIGKNEKHSFYVTKYIRPKEHSTGSD